MASLLRKRKCPPPSKTEIERPLTKDYDEVTISRWVNGGESVVFPFAITLPPKYQTGKKAAVFFVESRLNCDFGNPGGAWTNATALNNYTNIYILNSTSSFDEEGKPSTLFFSNFNGNSAITNGTYNCFQSVNSSTALGSTSLPCIRTTNSEIWLQFEWINALTGDRHIVVSSEVKFFYIRLRLTLLED